MELFTIEEVSDILKVSTQTTRRLIINKKRIY